jgi:CheY-like chemotaxis protein
MRILLVGDECSSARLTAKGLRERGYAIDIVNRARTADIEIVTRLEAQDVSVVADDELIRQLLMNWLDDVVRSLPAGRTVYVDLSADASTGTITVGTRALGSRPLIASACSTASCVSIHRGPKHRAPVSVCRSREGSPSSTNDRLTSRVDPRLPVCRDSANMNVG